MQNFFHKKKKHVLFNIETTNFDGLIGKAEEIFNKHNVEILNIQKINNKQINAYTYKFFAKCNNSSSKEIILNELCKKARFQGVRLVSHFAWRPRYMRPCPAPFVRVI
jgi:hypothetical protein